jgi:hypothetical protein
VTQSIASAASGPKTHIAAPTGNAIKYVVGWAFAIPNPAETQPLTDSLTNEGIAVRSIGHVQSWRSVGTPLNETNAAKASAAAR